MAWYTRNDTHKYDYGNKYSHSHRESLHKCKLEKHIYTLYGFLFSGFGKNCILAYFIRPTTTTKMRKFLLVFLLFQVFIHLALHFEIHIYVHSNLFVCLFICWLFFFFSTFILCHRWYRICVIKLKWFCRI